MKFNYGKIFILGFGSLGVSAIWIIYNSFVPLFLQERFHLEPAMIGFFMTLDNIAVLFILPPVGAWSDRIRTPFGRRIPFIAAGIPVAAAAFFFVPSVAALPLFAVCTITLIFSMALWRTPVVALLADITPSPYRSQANGIVNFMGGVGGITVAVGGGALFAVNQSYPFWMGACLVLLSGIVLIVFIREPEWCELNSDGNPGLIKSVRSILSGPDRNPLRIFTAHFFWIVALSAIEAFFTLYAGNHLNYPGDQASRILGQFPLMLILFALPAGIIGGKIGRKTSIITGLTILMLTLLTMYFLNKDTLIHVLITLPVLGTVPVIGGMLMICGCAWILVNVNSLPMIVDMTDDMSTGTFTGIAFFFVTAAAIAGPNINGWIIQLTGNNYSTIFLSSAAFIFIALIIMTGVKKGEAIGGR